jgi:hypothetical protein
MLVTQSCRHVYLEQTDVDKILKFDKVYLCVHACMCV